MAASEPALAGGAPNGVIPGTDEAALFAVIRQNAKGVTNDEIAAMLPSWPVERVAAAVNLLLKSKSVVVCTLGRSEAATLVYKEANVEETNRMKGLTENDLLVLQLISESDNLGIWSKDLRVRSNLQQNTMAKALKNLENRELIKAVKSVNTRNKKVYMLKHLEPSKEITGGAWYTEQEFDAEFITVLYETCFRYISDKGDGVTLEEIAEFICEKNISTVELRMEEVNQIVDTLVYDGRVDAIDSSEPGFDDECAAQMTYKAATLAIPNDSIFTSVGYSLFGNGFNEWLEDGEGGDNSFRADVE